MKTPIKFRDWSCSIELETYDDSGAVCIRLRDIQDGLLACEATVHIPELPLDKGWVFINSHDQNEGILECLYKHQVIDNPSIVNHDGQIFYKCKLLI